MEFQNYFQNAPDPLIKKMENDLWLKLYCSIGFKNEPNIKEIMHIFDTFFLF